MTRKAHPGPHKYQRVLWGDKETVVWRCMLPRCTHYLHDEFILGQESICWHCRAPFIIGPYSSQRVKPKCDKCKGSQRTKPKLDVEDLISDL